MKSRLALVGCLFLAASLLRAPTVHAQDASAEEETMKQARAAYAEGAELYETGDKKAAAQKFKLAYRLTKNALLLYNIGLIHDEINDHAIALHYYQKFVKDAPDDEKNKANRELATARIATITAEIAAEEAAEEEEVKEKDLKVARRESKRITKFVHRIVDEAPKGLPIDVVAKIPRRARWSLTLYFRSGGAASFEATRMRPRFLENVGRIPKKYVRGNAVQYYIEVKDRKGKLLANSGRASSPNVVYLDDESDPHYYKDLSEQGSTQMVRFDDLAIDESERETSGDGRDLFDIRGKPMQMAKWGATGTASAMATTWLIAVLLAQNTASKLEAEAIQSRRGATCAPQTPPCVQWSTTQRDLQSRGKTYNTIATVSLITAVLTGAAAGGLWYLDSKSYDDGDFASVKQKGPRFFATPVVGDGFVGGAATINF